MTDKFRGTSQPLTSQKAPGVPQASAFCKRTGYEKYSVSATSASGTGARRVSGISAGKKNIPGHFGHFEDDLVCGHADASIAYRKIS